MYRYVMAIVVLLLLVWPAAAQEAETPDCDFERDDAFAYYLHEGGLERGRGEYDLALAAYNCAYELQPDSPLVLWGRGNTLVSLGEYEAALQDYERRLELTPDDPVAHLNKGFALNRMGRHYDAIESFNQAIDLDTDYASAYLNRGNAYYLLGEYEDAIEDYEAALELDYDPPKHAYANLGRLFVDQEDYAQARFYYEKAVRSAPEDPVMHRVLGEVLYELGELDLALEQYQTYARLEGGRAEPHALERLQNLETRASLLRFLPLMVVGIIILYALGTFLWNRRRRGRRASVPEIAPSSPFSRLRPKPTESTPEAVEAARRDYFRGRTDTANRPLSLGTTRFRGRRPVVEDDESADESERDVPRTTRYRMQASRTATEYAPLDADEPLSRVRERLAARITEAQALEPESDSSKSGWKWGLLLVPAALVAGIVGWISRQSQD